MRSGISKISFSLLLAGALTIGCKKSGGDQTPNPDPNPPVSAIKIVHPGMLHTADDLAFVKIKVDAGLSPWKEGYDKFNTSTHLNLSYTANPTIKLIRGGNSTEEPSPDNYANAFRDSHAAYQMGIKWKLTGDDRWAAKGVEILNAWAGTCKSINGDSNKFLASGIYGFTFANAAELLRNYSGWKIEDFTAYKKWMLDVFYPLALDFLERHNGACNSHYWTNWDAANMCSVLSIGILTDDVSKVNYAINYFKKGIGNGNIDNAVTAIHKVNGEVLGQGQESGRDQGHATLVISLLGSFCQMAYNVGEDLFAYKDNKFLALCEYTAKYNYSDASGIFLYNVPFTEYIRKYNVNCSASETLTTVSAVGRGELRPCWELVYNHYAKVKGIEAKYSKMFAEKVRPEGGGSHYGPNSGGYDQLGFGTLLFSK
ncbi:GPI anchored protein [Pseudopedobacter saltans DSM 12145]|uniref:GPI anchored protein n=1 Tax=Pseudopedobacter saltans (strain ATCC 51119 / DSM 12145 / JCM 21818 / CCUG 39354 / LMG 10337 / NBRC 100064 / NCIMB 13643) TaxID=762903 RepID=F0S6F6_PSESL|nr:alginate lyase family protein [Pseudopedobacter saltans]ADY54282.1 GPI anchored protein [Pseudopedobacter saltans DSM 12145]